MPDQEVPLAGGLANPGAVVRVGETVRRPRSEQTDGVHALLRHVREAGFAGVPEPIGTDELGREILSFIPGDVPLPPYPAWSLTDDVLAAVARLLRGYHDAAAGFDPRGRSWSAEFADPGGGPTMCHNDVCPENVIFRKDEPVAIVDFDLVAPGRPVWDVARTISMWAPLREPSAVDDARASMDPVARFGTFCRAYGLGPGDADAILEAVRQVKVVGAAFMRRRFEAGEPAFVALWHEQGWPQSQDRTMRWLEGRSDGLRRELV